MNRRCFACLALWIAALAAVPARAIIDKEWQDLLDPSRYPPAPAPSAPPAQAVMPPPAFAADSAVEKITSKNIASEVTLASVPVLLFFYDETQQASRDVAVGIEAIARQAGGRYKVGRVDVREEPDLLPMIFPRGRTAPAAPVLFLVKRSRAWVMSIDVKTDDGSGQGTASIRPDGSPVLSTKPWRIGTPIAFEDDSPVAEVTKATYDQVVNQSPIPVLVVYYGDWCPHCREWAPYLESMARGWAGRIKVVRVNVEEEHELDKAFGAGVVPAFSYVSGGRAQRVDIKADLDGDGRIKAYRFLPVK